jgi:hypothetical protein
VFSAFTLFPRYHQRLPLVGAVEVFTHEEAATQQVIVQLRSLRVGEVPVADLHGIEKGLY